MKKQIATSRVASALALLCGCLLAIVLPSQARSIDEHYRVGDQEDPMIAIPSGHQYVIEHYQTPQPSADGASTQYVYSSSNGEVSQEQPELVVENRHQQPVQYVPRQIEYVRQDSPYTLVQIMPEQQQQQQRQEQEQQHQTHGDYSSEIIYVGQNGGLAKQSAHREQMAEVAGAISHNPGVPATILTEVPVKDMPHEVLEKLRRDYGVKVVATRERPGANLVINCDEYSNHDQSICKRSEPQTVSHHQQPDRQYVYEAVPTGAEHHFELEPHHEYDRLPQPMEHQPEQVATHIPPPRTHHVEYRIISQGGPTTTVATEPETRHEVIGYQSVEGHHQPQNEEGHQVGNEEQGASGQPRSENYGVRTTTMTISEQTESVSEGYNDQQPTEPSQQNHGAEQPQQQDHHQQEQQQQEQQQQQQQQPQQSSANDDSQNVGFDEQPKSGEEEQANNKQDNSNGQNYYGIPRKS